MGCKGSKHPAMLAACETGVMKRDHASDKGKSGAGGAALAKMDGNLLYVLGNKGLAIFDVAHPEKIDAAASKIAQVDTGCIDIESQCAMAFNGTHMYIAGGKGLAVFDVSDARNPQKVSDVIETGVLKFGDGAAMVINGNRLYVAGGKGLVVFDISKAQAPLKLGDVIDTGVITFHAQCALCLGTPPTADQQPPLYVCGGGGLVVFNLENPDVPQKQGDTIETGALKRDGGASMLLAGTRLFIAGGKGLGSLDVTNPMAPVKISADDTGVIDHVGGTALLVKDEAMYVCGGKGLGVYELVTHTAVQKAKVNTTVVSNTGGNALLLDGDVLYVAGGKGLASFKASQLVAPTN